MISELDHEMSGLNALQTAYEEFIAKLAPEVSCLDIDLTAVKPTDYSTLAFLESCDMRCREYKLEVNFNNASSEMAPIAKEIAENLNFRPIPKAKSVYLVAGEATYQLGTDIVKLTSFLDTLARSSIFYIKNPKKINWREAFYYMDSTGADAVPIVVMICFLVGVIMGYQGTDALGSFGLDIYIADLVAMSIVRELGPLMVAVICAGRAGSAFAAELGTMKVNEELDAFSTMGLNPQTILMLPKIIALMCVMPLLTIIGNVVGIIGGGFTATLLTDISGTEFTGRVLDFLVPANLGESLVKSVVFAFLIAVISCFRGFNADNDAKGVGNAATAAVVSSIFLVVIADACITIIYPMVMRLFGIAYGVNV